jgi:hypothetical protein
MHPSPKLPILIIEPIDALVGDVLAFESVQSAESYIEAIDVDNDEYKAWDSNGRVLSLTTEPRHKFTTSRAVHISVQQPEKLEPEKLEAYLVTLLRRNVDATFESRSLEETITKVVSWMGFTR